MKNRVWVWLTVLLTGLVLVAGLAGIFVPAIYANEAASWAAQGVGQDWVDVVFVVPALFIATLYLGRGSRRAATVWLGLLIYLSYSYLLYSLFMHFNTLFLIYTAILGLSVHMLVAGSAAPELQLPVTQIAGTLRKTTSAFLVLASLIFAMQWLGEIIPALATGAIPPSAMEVGFTVNPVHVIDLALILPAMIIAAVRLWRDRPHAASYAIALLVFMVAMGTSILGMFYMMNKRGLPIAAVPVVVMSIIIGISVFFSARLLRAV